jgi:hypothetical protein
MHENITGLLVLPAAAAAADENIYGQLDGFGVVCYITRQSMLNLNRTKHKHCIIQFSLFINYGSRKLKHCNLHDYLTEKS